MTAQEKLEFYGHRRVLVGGKDSDDDDDDEEPLEADAEADNNDDDEDGIAKIPINFHVLPVSVIMDFVVAWKVKHVLDFMPTPLPLALALVEKGISYFALCGTAANTNTNTATIIITITITIIITTIINFYYYYYYC